MSELFLTGDFDYAADPYEAKSTEIISKRQALKGYVLLNKLRDYMSDKDAASNLDLELFDFLVHASQAGFVTTWVADGKDFYRVADILKAADAVGDHHSFMCEEDLDHHIALLDALKVVAQDELPEKAHPHSSHYSPFEAFRPLG